MSVISTGDNPLQQRWFLTSKHQGYSLWTSQSISLTWARLSSDRKIRTNNLLTEQTRKQPVWEMTRGPCFCFCFNFVIWLICISHFEIFWDRHLNCDIEFHRYGASQSPHGNPLLLLLLQTADLSLGLHLSQKGNWGQKTLVTREGHTQIER